MKGACNAGSCANGANGSGMGPKPPKDQPFGDTYRLPWGSHR